MAKATHKGSAADDLGPRPWTVMVYMVAGTDAALDAIAVQDIREMERAVAVNGSAQGASPHVVVQINRAWPDSFQRYEIRKAKNGQRGGHSALIESDDDASDMGNEETLAEFLKWAVQHYPAEHYFLVLWGHAYGLGFGRDHGDPLTLKELRGALEQFRVARSRMASRHKDLARLLTSDGRLDLLGANACAMSYIELKDHAQYLVASQISVPFAGWPYESILSRTTAETTPADLGRLVVDTYVSHFTGSMSGERVAMSLLNLAPADRFKDLVKRFAIEI